MKRLNWVNIIFFALTPIAAIGGTAWLVSQGGPHWATWTFAVVMLFATGMSITAGYHRLFSHRAYETVWPVRFLLVLFGSASFQGSVLWWAAEHRIHHRFEDTEQDPYNINKGFWYAHIGWLLEKREDASLDIVKDLQKDPLLRWQQKIYLVPATLMSFVFPAAVASLWGDFWGGFFVAGLLRMVVNHHVTFSINSFCHLLGRQTYSDEITARDSWITALMTYGEGYHNFHHRFKADYRNAIKAYQWDPTKWLIAFLNSIGLAKNLRRANRLNILQARINADEERYLSKLAMCSESVRHKAQEMLDGTRDQLQHAHTRFLQLKSEYRQLKNERIDSVRVQLDELRRELRWARQEFRVALNEWRLLINDPIGALA